MKTDVLNIEVSLKKECRITAANIIVYEVRVRYYHITLEMCKDVSCAITEYLVYVALSCHP